MALKGVAPFALAAIVGILLLTIFLLPLTIFFTYKKHIIVSLTLNYEVSNTELVLLVSLFDQTNYRYLAERDIIGYLDYYTPNLVHSFKGNLKSTLHLSTLSPYELIGEDGTIIKYGTLEEYTSASTIISKPYNPRRLTEMIILKVEK